MGRKTTADEPRLTVFYDGACGVCAREINHYRGIDTEGRLALVDISAADFDPAAHGRTLDQFMAELHVLTPEGEFLTGVAAFAAIWDRLPGAGFPFLASLVRFPLVSPLADLGYALFARFRRYLPSTREVCEGGTCHIGHRK